MKLSLRNATPNRGLKESIKQMDILHEIENIINEFNRENNENFSIDTIRIEFQKQYKLSKLKEIGRWKKISTTDTKIMSKLKRRLTDDEVTTAHQLENENIYYYNTSTPPKYRKACLVIFGMKQYHKEPPKRETIEKILSILKDVSNIDLCIDLPHSLNINALKKVFNVHQYITKDGLFTDTHYIYKIYTPMIEKITIYNKAIKNKLDRILWRIEAKIIIPNKKILVLPLHDLQEIINIARRAQ